MFIFSLLSAAPAGQVDEEPRPHVPPRDAPKVLRAALMRCTVSFARSLVLSHTHNARTTRDAPKVLRAPASIFSVRNRLRKSVFFVRNRNRQTARTASASWVRAFTVARALRAAGRVDAVHTAHQHGARDAMRCRHGASGTEQSV